MTTLSDIRDLETRLHSHFLEWDDKPLQDELLWALDEMQLLHEKLDTCDVPSTGTDGLDMTLHQRLDWLEQHYLHSVCEQSKDFYGHPIPVQPRQIPLF